MVKKLFLGIVSLLVIMSIIGCGNNSYDEGKEDIEKVTKAGQKLEISDAHLVLDLLPLLPKTFEEVDSASEGLSNADLGLGETCSEVYLFISEEPFQMIYCFLSISESRIEQASFDAIMNDEEQIKDLLEANLIAGALEEGMEIEEIEIQVTFPSIGDSCFLGEGYFTAYGLVVGFDMLWFRLENTYIFLYSAYYSTERQTLLPIARELEQRIRIGQYSQ